MRGSAAQRYGPVLASSALFFLGPALPFVVSVLERRRGTGPTGSSLAPLPDDPLVEVVVPAYLEASTVGATVERLTADLEKAGLRHVVHVVASDDATAVAAEQAAARVTRTAHDGKPAAVNIAVQASTADIVVMTDANCRIEPEGWPATMLEELAHAGLLSANKTEVAGQDSLFWRFEQIVKRQVSGHDSTVAVVGEFLAFRREHFRPVPKGTISDDLWLAIDFHTRGLRVVVSQTITTSEEAAVGAEQWERRVRIASGQLAEVLPRLPTLVRTPAGRHYLSHKMYRLTVGAGAFWTAVVSVAGLRPRVTLPATVVLLTGAIARYRGVIRVRTPLDPVLAVPALQAVPVAAAVRLARRRLRPPADAEPGWRKAAR